MITARSISLSIKHYCKEKNISQRKLAKLLGVSQQTVNRWVLEQRRPSLASIEKLQRIIGKMEEK